VISPEEFKGEVRQLARRMKTEAREIHLRPMKNKWASCSSGGRLTFDTKLLDEPDKFRKDVIVHELLHLSVPNHGKMFKVLQRSYVREESRLPL
jgi:predicted metal-dependent hydrolase